MNKKHLNSLAKNPWLLDIPEPSRKKLIQSARIRSFKSGQQIQRKGEQADGLYGVLEGEIKISTTTFFGDEIAFTRLKPGFWFGEIALLDGGVRTHDAHASANSILAVLPKNALLALSQSTPSIYQALVRLLCEHCRDAFTAIDELLLFNPEQRLAQRILNLLKTTPSKTSINISQQELGRLIGVSRQSTNKILNSWEKKGWIIRSYRKIEIRHRNALETDILRK